MVVMLLPVLCGAGWGWQCCLHLKTKGEPWREMACLDSPGSEWLVEMFYSCLVVGGCLLDEVSVHWDCSLVHPCSHSV